ncbi:MAG: methyltransferase, partial [Candidatus Bathyarchaeia archaeon]
MSSRERVALALNHREPDCVPLDLGGSPTTGMHVSTVYALRQALALDPPDTPVKVIEPYQMLGEIASDLCEALGVDVVGLSGKSTMFGFKNEGWKPWRL